jgi:protein SCO1/2
MKVSWLLATTMAIGLLAACGDASWRTKDISGLMPDLALELTAESGETITASRFEDRVTLLFFGYTNCPDICPVTMGKLATVMGKLPASVAEQVRVLFVSVDPDRDTPKRLRQYTGAFGERFIGATGTQQQLRALSKRYRVTYSYGSDKGEGGSYLVSHSSAVFVFDDQSRVRLMFRQDDSIDAMAADLKRLVR